MAQGVGGGGDGDLRQRMHHFGDAQEQVAAQLAGGVKARDLAAKFGTDRTRRAGDKNNFAFECATNLAFF